MIGSGKVHREEDFLQGPITEDMTKTQPIQTIDLTIGPAAVSALAADLRQPSQLAGQVHPVSPFGSRSLESPRAPRMRSQLHLVVVNNETTH